jgi:hypothetical protein
VLAGLVQLILVEDNVEHLRGALGQLLRRHQLHVDVSRLRLRQIKGIVSRDGDFSYLRFWFLKKAFSCSDTKMRMLPRRIKGVEKYYF